MIGCAMDRARNHRWRENLPKLLEKATRSPGVRLRASNPHHMDRADQVCVDLIEDLFIRKLFNGVEEAVARVDDEEIDLAAVGEGLIHNPMGAGTSVKSIRDYRGNVNRFVRTCRRAY
jgi:hypothetical protein